MAILTSVRLLEVLKLASTNLEDVLGGCLPCTWDCAHPAMSGMYRITPSRYYYYYIYTHQYCDKNNSTALHCYCHPICPNISFTCPHSPPCEYISLSACSWHNVRHLQSRKRTCGCPSPIAAYRASRDPVMVDIEVMITWTV